MGSQVSRLCSLIVSEVTQTLLETKEAREHPAHSCATHASATDSTYLPTYPTAVYLPTYLLRFYSAILLVKGQLIKNKNTLLQIETVQQDFWLLILNK